MSVCNCKFVDVLLRLNFSTAFSTNAVSICHSAGLISVVRVEQSSRYLVHFSSSVRCSDDAVAQVLWVGYTGTDVMQVLWSVIVVKLF